MSDWKAPKFGSPCWMGLPATDVERAAKFYKTVFDWTFKGSEKYAPDAIQMFDFRPDVNFGGGIQRVPDPETGMMKPGVSGVCLYWLVEDLEKTAPLIEQAGGKLLTGVVKESTSGIFRLFEDTEGNLGGAYQFVGGSSS